MNYISRLTNYEKYMKLYKGLHYEVFEGSGKTRVSYDDYAMSNYLKKVADYYVNLLLTNSAKILLQSENNQDFISTALFDSKFNEKLKENVLNGLITGDIVFVVTRSKRLKKTIIEFVNPKFYKPVFSKYNENEVERHRIEVGDLDGKSVKVFEDYYDENLDTYIYVEKIIKNDTEIILKELKHNSGNLIHHIKVNAAPYEQFGTSVFQPLENIQKFINRLGTQILSILRKYANPKVKIDSDLFILLNEKAEQAAKQRGLSSEKIKKMKMNGQTFIRFENIDFFPVDAENPTGKEIEYLTFDGSVSENISQRDKLIYEFAVISSISSSVLKADTAVIPPSGSALRLMNADAITTITGLAESLKYELAQAIYQMQTIEIQEAPRPSIKVAEKATVSFSHFLPTDEVEQNMILQKKDRGLISTRTARQELYPNWTTEQHEEEEARLEEEASKEQELMSRGSAFPPRPPYPSEDEDGEENSSEEEVGEEDEE